MKKMLLVAALISSFAISASDSGCMSKVSAAVKDVVQKTQNTVGTVAAIAQNGIVYVAGVAYPVKLVAKFQEQAQSNGFRTLVLTMIAAVGLEKTLSWFYANYVADQDDAFELE